MRKILFLWATFVGNSILGNPDGEPLSFSKDGDRAVSNLIRPSKAFERTNDLIKGFSFNGFGTHPDSQMISHSPALPMDTDNSPHREPFPVEQHLPGGEDEEEKKMEEEEDEESDEKKNRSLETLQKAIQALQDPKLILGIQNCSNLDQLAIFKKSACSALLAVQKRQETIV